LHIFKSIAY
jgi:hypothetical protein